MDYKSCIVEKLKEMKPMEVAMVNGFIKALGCDVTVEAGKNQHFNDLPTNKSKEISEN